MTSRRSNILSKLFAILSLSIFVASITTPYAHADDVASLNRTAWDQCLDSADAVPATRFAFYAYRSLAVAHPEIYLQSDEVISDVLEDLPGSRLAYRSRDARDVELYLRLARREVKGATFDWGMVSTTPDSIFDKTQVREPSDWLTMRCPSVAVLLKSDSPYLSTFESALLRYSQLSRARTSADSLFVVIDKKGIGYLAGDTMLWVAGLPDRPVGKWRDVSPAMVFNCNSVYSSITGRDDRSTDSMLARVMAKLGKPASISFRSQDSKRTTRLKSVTSLESTESKQLAVLAASGLLDVKQPRVARAWLEYSGFDSTAAACATLQLNEIYFWANRLSMYTAELAAAVSKTELLPSLQAVQEKYLAWAGRRVSPGDTADKRVEAWGCLWSYDLMLTLIDDNIRTRAGSSFSQASAMTAVLELAGVDHFQLAVRLGDKQIPDQEWLFADNGRLQYNLGVWTEVPSSTPAGARPPTLLIKGFTVRGSSVVIERGVFCGGMHNLTICEHLTRILRLMPIASLSFVSPTGESVSVQKLLVELTADRYIPAAPKWPGPPEG